MSRIIKKLKNKTLSDILHSNSGYFFPPSVSGVYVEVDEDLINRVCDPTMKGYFDNDQMDLMWDGVSGYTKREGWDKLSNAAWGVPFASSSVSGNNFDATTIQTAAEEIDFRQVVYEPTGFFDRTQCTISFTNGTRTFTITPVSGSFTYYIRGKKYVKTGAENVAITDNEGLWYIYYNGSTLTASQTAWGFGDPVVFVATVYWDAASDTAITFSEERHGLVMDWSTHRRLHNVDRTTVEKYSFTAGDYILDGDGSSNAHAQISFTNGVIHDEDLIMSVTNSATPTNPFEQTLSTIAKIPIYYRTGSQANPSWRKVTATNYSVYSNSPNPCYYNLLTGGNWTLTNTTSGYFIVTWLLATNNIYEPIIGVLGDNQQANLLDAERQNVLTKIDLPILTFGKEARFLYRLIWQTATSYTNTPKAALREVASDISDTIITNSNVTPPFIFSKSGGCAVGAYLYVGQVVTSTAGQLVRGTNNVVGIFATNQGNLANNTVIQIQRRTGVSSFVDIAGATCQINAGTYKGQNTPIAAPIGPDWELSCYNKSGSSLSNPIVTVYVAPA